MITNFAFQKVCSIFCGASKDRIQNISLSNWQVMVCFIFILPNCLWNTIFRGNKTESYFGCLWGNPDRFLLWWMAQGSCTYPVAVKCDPCPWAVDLFGLLDLVGLGRWWANRWEAVGIWKRHEKETSMQFMGGFLLLLLFPPPSASAANAAGLQECIIIPPLH